MPWLVGIVEAVYAATARLDGAGAVVLVVADAAAPANAVGVRERVVLVARSPARASTAADCAGGPATDAAACRARIKAGTTTGCATGAAAGWAALGGCGAREGGAPTVLLRVDPETVDDGTTTAAAVLPPYPRGASCGAGAAAGGWGGGGGCGGTAYRPTRVMFMASPAGLVAIDAVAEEVGAGGQAAAA